MKKQFVRFVIKLSGWQITDQYPELKKSVCIMAPHTSMWDFVWGKLYFMTQGIKPRILIKSEMFTWYLKPLLKALGGVPVYRKHPVGLVEQMLKYFEETDEFTLIITPEATRKPVKKWKTGALRIAKMANVPLVLGKMDYKTKTMGLANMYMSIPDDSRFINTVKNDFVGVTAKHPENFNPYYEQ
ncbi:MAG: glycerol acyltransferase [Bacteroidota bacterium]|nr:glycerol acyltransferase [Bacteroidota bacterium]